MFAPQLNFSILRQESIAKEKFSRNAIQKEVCVVAKGLAFSIDISSTSIDFHNAKIYAKLFYDSDDEDFKPIELPKSDPLTYKVFISTSGDRTTVECRIYVLTSQHENALFRVKIGVAVGAQTLEIASEPIRVVSKPSQIQKEKRKRAGTVTTAPPSPISIPSTPALVAATTASTACCKRPLDPLSVMDSLRRLEEQQKEQRQLIEHLISAKTEVPLEDEFEAAFNKFLNAWSKLPIDERPTKMHKVVSATSSNTETFNDFLQVCATPDSGVKALSLSHLLMEDFSGTNKEEVWDSLVTNFTWTPESDAIREPEQI